VIGLDVNAEALDIARALYPSSTYPNLAFVPGLSIGRNVDTDPDVLICELLGPCGLDERIVETVRDFVTRHPSVRHVIPRTLTLLAAPVRSVELEARYEDLIDSIRTASPELGDHKQVDALVERALCSVLLPCWTSDARVTGPSTPVATFVLGQATTSSFRSTIEFPAVDFEFVHLYFDAELAPSITLSTALGCPVTHWEPHFVKRAGSSRLLEVSYGRRDQRFVMRWLPPAPPDSCTDHRDG
jgi:hypothetical protein